MMFDLPAPRLRHLKEHLVKKRGCTNKVLLWLTEGCTANAEMIYLAGPQWYRSLQPHDNSGFSVRFCMCPDRSEKSARFLSMCFWWM
jgi:hypothetical protein